MADLTDLITLAKNLLASGPLKVETTPRRVRGLFDGVYLFDTTSALWVWEHGYYPQFWIPISAVAPGMITKGPAIDKKESAFLASVQGYSKGTDRVLVFEKGPLDALVRFEFGCLDAWFEEDTQIYEHPKNPYTRIDILPSSRAVEVRIGGVTLAESSNPVCLFETGLRTRYYIPKTSVEWGYFTESNTVRRCAYKGQARYYNVTINGIEYEDILWCYEYPTAESAAIRGLVCFCNERVDMFVDSVLEEK